MGQISAQVSLYPLRQRQLARPITAALQIFQASGVHFRPGEMSTLVWGETEAVFSALRAAFEQAVESGDTVMTVTLSNACPLPAEP